MLSPSTAEGLLRAVLVSTIVMTFLYLELTYSSLCAQVSYFYHYENDIMFYIDYMSAFIYYWYIQDICKLP